MFGKGPDTTTRLDKKKNGLLETDLVDAGQWVPTVKTRRGAHLLETKHTCSLVKPAMGILGLHIQPI